MYIILIILIVLMIKIISNQQNIDEHLCDTVNNQYQDDMICNKGIINKIIFRLRVWYADIIYYFKKESK